MIVRNTIVDIIRDRRERETSGDRDPWTWRDIAKMCCAAAGNCLYHPVAEAFAYDCEWAVKQALHSALYWEGVKDTEIAEYINSVDWLLPNPSEEA